MNDGRYRASWIVYAALAVVAAAYLLPFAWMVCVSWKTPQEVFTPHFFPRGIRWDELSAGQLAAMPPIARLARDAAS